MRDTKDMLELILRVAREHERIRAVLLQGSRADPNAEPDIFQDFDVVYLVNGIDSLRADPTWIDQFGKRTIRQTPEDMVTPPPVDDGRYSYLMLLADGNRIDLTLLPVSDLGRGLPHDSMSILLLDKDDTVGPLPEPSDRDHRPKPSDEKAFLDSCNEFWWVSTYIAKGLWRREIFYAKRVLEGVLREELVRMLSWHIGIKTGFSRSLGSHGRHVARELEPELLRLLHATYSETDCEATWDSLFAMCDLFRSLAVAIAERCGFEYPVRDDEETTAHLKHVRSLPGDAREIY